MHRCILSGFKKLCDQRDNKIMQVFKRKLSFTRYPNKNFDQYTICVDDMFFLNSIKYLQALPHGSISGERDTFSSRSMTVVADSSSACLWARVAAWSSIRRTMSWSTMAPLQRTHKRPLWGKI